MSYKTFIDETVVRGADPDVKIVTYRKKPLYDTTLPDFDINLVPLKDRWRLYVYDDPRYHITGAVSGVSYTIQPHTTMGQDPVRNVAAAGGMSCKEEYDAQERTPPICCDIHGYPLRIENWTVNQIRHARFMGWKIPEKWTAEQIAKAGEERCEHCGDYLLPSTGCHGRRMYTGKLKKPAIDPRTGEPRKKWSLVISEPGVRRVFHNYLYIPGIGSYIFRMVNYDDWPNSHIPEKHSSLIYTLFVNSFHASETLCNLDPEIVLTILGFLWVVRFGTRTSRFKSIGK